MNSYINTFWLTFTGQRFLSTVFYIFIIKILTFIALPGIDRELIRAMYERNSEILSFLNSMTGGSFERFAISTLYLAPYIQASIIMNFLTVSFESFKAVKKDSYKRKELHKYQRFLTFALSIVQSFVLMQTIQRVSFSAIIDNSLSFRLLSVIIFSTTSILIVWISERITEVGVGNGTSVVIFASIVSTTARWLHNNLSKTFFSGEIFYVLWLGLIFGLPIILCECTLYLIPLFFKRSSSLREEEKKYNTFPIKINPAGILPAMFSESLMPIIIVPISFFNDIFSLNIDQNNKGFHLMIKAFLIVFLYMLCLGMVIEPEDAAEAMKNRGAYFNKIREGSQTANFLSHKLLIIGILGIAYSVCVLVIPDLLGMYLDVSLRGTSMLILILSAIDIYDRVVPKAIAK